ncbi:MAG: hypothetical protein ACYDBQ_05970 [Thermoplasmatota archaeon]
MKPATAIGLLLAAAFCLAMPVASAADGLPEPGQPQSFLDPCIGIDPSQIPPVFIDPESCLGPP